MSQTLTLQLKDETFSVLQRQAQTNGTSPADWAARILEGQCELSKGPARGENEAEARLRFERHFGEVNLGSPAGSDNEAIDADLAREYAANHENY